VYVVYMDECGFSFGWKESIDEQPFYVLSAVAIPMEKIHPAYEEIRQSLENLQIPWLNMQMLGWGEEIKAKELDRGEGYWSKHERERQQVRELFLSIPYKYSGVSFIVVIDKQRHFEKYVNPEDPDKLAIQFALERIQGFLESENDVAICFFDKTKREPLIRDTVAELIKDGSWITYWSEFYQIVVAKQISISRIVEFHMADSRYSIGLQVADFFARHVHSWRKNNKDPNTPGWQLIKKSLYKQGDKIIGFGYKEFPEGGLDETK
jgi:hypothetical protein